MEIVKRNASEILILLPPVFAFLLALVPSLKYSTPLTWDIYYHIHNAMLYMERGIVFWDPLTCAPYGRPICYPPLFHIMLILLVKITGLDFLTVSRFIQPVIAFLIILSFSYVAGRFYGFLTGFLTGMLSISSLFFLRIIMPIPEAMAMIFVPFFVYGYHLSMENDSKLYPLLTGLILGVLLLTHLLSAALVLSVVLISALASRICGYSIKPGNLLVIILTGAMLAMIWYAPLLIRYGFFFRPPPADPLSIAAYMHHFGALLIVLALTGLICALKRRERRDILMTTWFIFVLALSAGYTVGLKVLSDRILYFALFPAAAMGASIFNSMRMADRRWPVYVMVLFISVYSLCSGYGIASTVKPEVSESELEVAQWFEYNGDHKTVVVSDYHIQPLIVSIAGQPVSAGGYAPGSKETIDARKYTITLDYTEDDIKIDGVGYIILDTENRKTPPYSREVYRNMDFVVYRVGVY
ncbi:hypothetical protein [Methanothermobacter sp. K4]|uniref:hypothetical protein n=1 Tax=Methanothermobacter sp. K4 TaxID=2913262 RepID=UPI001EDB9056|nr:hypothetical protein [Methanothermobacter sp. K4]MCG2827787.1 hypothetical protein [Methanothermobacter sp. K4]